MRDIGPRLTMEHFLQAVRAYGVDTPEALQGEGFPFKVVYRKAEKAVSKGYTGCGVVPHRPWLTPKGEAFLNS